MCSFVCVCAYAGLFVWLIDCVFARLLVCVFGWSCVWWFVCLFVCACVSGWLCVCSSVCLVVCFVWLIVLFVGLFE